MLSRSEWYAQAKDEAVSSFKNGVPITVMVKRLEVSSTTIRKWLEEEGIEVKRGRRPNEKSDG